VSTSRFSIVTPSFRSSRWLKLCVASVADQKGVSVEHIVQDACSDDETAEWLPRDPRVKASIEKDDGMYDAINRGWRRATGEICGHLNCDEQYLPGALAKVAHFFAAHPEVDVLFGDVVLVDENGSPLSYRRSIMPTKTHLRLAHLSAPTCATFFRHELLERGFYFDPQWKVIGDAVRMESLLNAKVKMAMLREPLAVFALTGENLSDTPLATAEKQRLKGTDSAWKTLIKILAIGMHRLRKFLSGAYRSRTVSVSVYTANSPGKREDFTRKVGSFWPT
jgi:glycosyltransferase involved in cell wall biosynthesis